MLGEIQGLYLEEIKIYSKILNVFKGINVDEIDFQRYQMELENIDYLIDEIRNINGKIEQLKTIYMIKNRIDDFIGVEIKKVEDRESYNEFKKIVNDASTYIIEIKKINDDIKVNLREKSENSHVLRKSYNSNIQSKCFERLEKNNIGNNINSKK